MDGSGTFGGKHPANNSPGRSIGGEHLQEARKLRNLYCALGWDSEGRVPTRLLGDARPGSLFK